MNGFFIRRIFLSYFTEIPEYLTMIPVAWNWISIILYSEKTDSIKFHFVAVILLFRLYLESTWKIQASSSN